MSPGRNGEGRRDGWSRPLTNIALVVVTAVGAVIRAEGLTSLGLYRDDAWAAMSSRVGIGTAWHMWVTAPGFYLLERSFIGLHSGATWWDQIPPLVAGIAAIPAIYFLARHFGFHRVAGLVLALVVCVSPVCIIYSTRVKEYGVVFLVTCAVLAMGETTRRTPDRTRLVVLAAVSVVAFVVSASLGPVIAGVWIALGLLAVRERRNLRQVIVNGAVVAGACGAVAAVFYSHISPALARFWNGAFITHGSAGDFLSSLRASLWGLYAKVLHLSAGVTAVQLVILLVVLGLSVLGMHRNAAMLAPACAVLVALGASALRVAPLGTGRTDEYIYPALLLLLASGVVRLWAVIGGGIGTEERRVVGFALAVLSMLMAGALMGQAIVTTPPYPGVAVPALAAALRRNVEPGDHIVVGELARYPWAYYEDHPLRLRFGIDWSTNFTVVSTDPDVFIVPSEYYEGGSQPVRWANAMSRYRRVWFVESPPLSLNPTYAALVHDGWHRVRTLNVHGGAAILLERGT